MSAEWSGPAWAAPESAERIRSRIEDTAPTRERYVFGVLCAALAEGIVEPEPFRAMLRLGGRR